jgi:hypothetical protein
MEGGDKDETEERTEMVENDLAVLRFEGSMGGTGGRLVEAEEMAGCLTCGPFAFEEPLAFALTFDAMEAVDALRVRTERSEFAVLNAVEASDLVDNFDTGRETGRDAGAAFRKVDACERTDTKDEAEELGMDGVVLIDGVGAAFVGVLGLLGLLGLFNVTFTDTVELDLSEPSRSSSGTAR